MKIFNISLNRSATASIQKALKILGINATHDIHLEHINLWKKGKEQLLHREIKNYDALTCGLAWFGNNVLTELIKNHPDAYYIIIKRPLASWLDSWERHKIIMATTNIISGGSYRTMIKTSDLIKIWEGHRLFINNLSENINTITIPIDDLRWEILAPLLKKPIPDQPFPRVNISTHRTNDITETIKSMHRTFIKQPPEQKPQRSTRLFKHLLLTRYNIRLYNNNERQLPQSRKKTILQPEGWMWHRYWLFREFCVPSIMRQINQDFTWLVAMDTKTPKRHLKHIESILPPNARIIMVSSLEEISDIVNIESESMKYTLSTMIDNDDMLHEDATESIQSLARRVIRRRKPSSHCIDMPSGYTINEDLTEFYECELVNAKRSQRTSFVSYLSNGPSSINALQYGPLCKTDKKRISFLQPRLWARIIHMANLSNELLGSRCSMPPGFGMGMQIKLPANFPGI